VNTVLDEVRRGVGPAGQVTRDVVQATARLNDLLTKADYALADLQAGKGTLGKLLTSDSLYTELSGSLGQINAALKDLREGEGTARPHRRLAQRRQGQGYRDRRRRGGARVAVLGVRPDAHAAAGGGRRGVFEVQPQGAQAELVVLVDASGAGAGLGQCVVPLE